MRQRRRTSDNEDTALLLRTQVSESTREVASRGRPAEYVPDRERSRFRTGLGNMKNRMGESGGTCEIFSSSTGTHVTITYPYPTTPTAKNTTNVVWRKPKKSANIAG